MDVSEGPFQHRLRRLARRGARAPLGALLRAARSEAVRAVCAEHGRTIAALGPRLRDGEHSARLELDHLAESAFASMRQRVGTLAQSSSWVVGCSATLDAWWSNAEQLEYLDDPHLDPEKRVAIVARLDGLNALLGSYALFFDYLRPLLSRDRRTKVLDLAAGHGGFALAAAALAERTGCALEVVASDIKREYLELGAARARSAGLDVRFRVQDALDLSNLDVGEYDVVTCTQSLHHFRPGQVAVMFAEAARVARRGVLFIDGARSALNAVAVVGFGLLAYRDSAFAHDALISFRRFFVPEELDLLARLSPWGASSSAEWIPPAHCLLRSAS